ncbi:MAG: DUF1330 domain-containing protein [Pseudolabrys sp.]|jgi:uncharacterized protein (DUF1330 family)
MRIQYAVALVVATGLGLGAVAIRGLHAQTKPPVYVVMEINEITDADGFKALLKTDPSSVVEAKDSDGRYLARTENVTALDGTAPKFFVIIAFDNLEKAKAYSDNMKETSAMRIKTTKSRSFVVEGK